MEEQRSLLPWILQYKSGESWKDEPNGEYLSVKNAFDGISKKVVEGKWIWRGKDYRLFNKDTQKTVTVFILDEGPVIKE